MSQRSLEHANFRTARGARAVRAAYLDLLDRWPVPCTRLRVPTGQGETFVVACGPGDAPPVLALQGSGATAAMWLPQIGALARHLRVYAVDTIGEPGLSAASRPPLKGDAHALWLDDVMRGLGLESAAMVGVSLGGWLALDYATRRPGRVTRLAVMCPSGVGRTRVATLVRVGLLSLFGGYGRRRAVAVVLGPGGGRDDPHPTAGAVEANRAVGEFAMTVFRHFKPRMEAVPTFDDDTLRRLTMPVLAIVGERDALLDSRHTRDRLRAAAPHARVDLIPGAGHLLPDWTAPVLDFLRGAGTP